FAFGSARLLRPLCQTLSRGLPLPCRRFRWPHAGLSHRQPPSLLCLATPADNPLHRAPATRGERACDDKREVRVRLHPWNSLPIRVPVEVPPATPAYPPVREKA